MELWSSPRLLLLPSFSIREVNVPATTGGQPWSQEKNMASIRQVADGSPDLFRLTFGIQIQFSRLSGIQNHSGIKSARPLRWPSLSNFFPLYADPEMRPGLYDSQGMSGGNSGRRAEKLFGREVFGGSPVHALGGGLH